MLHLYSGQQKASSKQKFQRHFSEGSNLNNVLSASTTSAAPQGDGLSLIEQTFTSQDQCSSVPENKHQISCPLLHSLLKGNCPDFKFVSTSSSSSEETDANIELNTATNVLDERHCKVQQVRNLIAAINCDQTRRQNIDFSGETLPTPHQLPVCSPPISGQLSTNVSTLREMQPLTDDQILDFIAARIECFRTILTQKNRYCGHTHTKEVTFLTNDRDFTPQSDDIMLKSSVAHLPTSSASVRKDVERQGLNCAVIEQCTAAVEGQTPEEDSSKFTLKSKETEYPPIMMKVAATCTTNEDGSPVVLTAVSEVTLEKLTEKHPNLTLNCSLSQEEYKPFSLNMNTNLDDADHVPGVSWPLNNMAEKENGETGIIPMEAVGLDNVHGVTDVSEDLQIKSSSMASESKTFELSSLLENQDANTQNIEDQQHCAVTCKEAIAHSRLNSSIYKIEIHNVVSILTNHCEWLCNQTRCEGVREDSRYVHSQTDLSIAQLNKVQEQATLSERKGEEAHTLKCFKDPLYEDISDEDISQLAKKLANTEYEGLSLPPCFEDLHYEDISEDENPQIENMSEERPSLTQVPVRNNKQSPFENEGYGYVQSRVQMRTETVSDELIPKKQVSPKTETLDIAQQADDDFESDNQIDDKWMVMPIIMSDLKFEPEYEDQGGPENGLLGSRETGDKCETSQQMNVFDTVESFLNANYRSEVASCRSPPRNRRESYSEPEDSCETEDSCDYSSGFGLKKEGEDGVTNVQIGQASSERVHPKTKRQKLSKVDDIIILDSDTDDDYDQNCKRKPNGKRLLSSGSEDNGDARCVQQKRHSHESLNIQRETVKEKIKKNRLPSADSPESQRRSVLHDTQFKEVMQDVCPDLSHSKKKSGQLYETKAGSEHVQHKSNRQRISKNEIVIILDSDTEDDYDQNCKKKSNGNRLFASGSQDSGDAPCVQQKRHSLETVDDQSVATKKKLKETRLSSPDSSLPQCQSGLHDTQYKELKQDVCSDLSNCIKPVHLIEAKGGSKRVQHKTNRPTSSRKRVSFHDSDKVFKKDNFSKKNTNTKTILSSGSELSGDSPFATQNRLSTETVGHLYGTVNEKPKTNRLSSEDSPEKPLSVDKEVDSTLSPNPVISRLVVQSSQHNDYLKPEESQVHRQDKEETWTSDIPTATGKKTDLCEKDMRHFYRNENGIFVPKPKCANDRHDATKNKVQANVIKASLVSQLLLPSQDGPSTSISSSSITSEKVSEARQCSTSSRGLTPSGETSSSLPKSKHCTSIGRQHLSSSKLQRSHSYSNPSTFDHPNTKAPSSTATMEPSTRKRVIKDWRESFVPTRRDRKDGLGMDEDCGTTNHNFQREARPRPSHYDRTPRQRHNSHESETPLMKRTKSDAKQWTKAINRDTPREQRCFVGEGYKWSQKPTMAKPTKGHKKCQSPASPHL